ARGHVHAGDRPLHWNASSIYAPVLVIAGEYDTWSYPEDRDGLSATSRARGGQAQRADQGRHALRAVREAAHGVLQRSVEVPEAVASAAAAVALGPLRPFGTIHVLGPLRPLGALFALGPLDALIALGTFRPLVALRPFRAFLPLRP